MFKKSELSAACTPPGWVCVPVETLRELYFEQVANAFNAGFVRPDGTWWTGGMSDAEWLERLCKMPHPINAEVLFSRLPRLVDAMIAAAPGAKE